MRYKCLVFGVLLTMTLMGHAQSGVDSVTNKVLNFPSKLFARLNRKTAGLNQQLTQQTEKYLEKMMKQEQKMQKKLMSVDSNGAKTLFANSQQQYAGLIQKLK